MSEELYFKLLEASMKHEEYLATTALLFFILAGLLTLTICSGIAYYSSDHCYEPRSKFSKLFYPSTIVTAVLALFFIYNVRQCSSYPSKQDIDSIIRDLDKIKKINTKTVENN